MNPFNYNQPDSRDILSRLTEMFSPILETQYESILRLISANSYGSDFKTLMDVLTGNIHTLTITSKTIDNAAEHYKQVNKALLYFRYLNDAEKIRESNEIDFEAARLKNDWYCKLRQMRISII